MNGKLYLMGNWLNGYEQAELFKEDEEEANELNPTYEEEGLDVNGEGSK